MRKAVEAPWELANNSAKRAHPGHYSQCYFLHRCLNNVWFNKANSLIQKPYFAIITDCKRSCGKVMFLHLSISHSVYRGRGLIGRGVCVSQHVMGKGADPHPPRWALKRAVSILLECILFASNEVYVKFRNSGQDSGTFYVSPNKCSRCGSDKWQGGTHLWNHMSDIRPLTFKRPFFKFRSVFHLTTKHH